MMNIKEILKEEASKVEIAITAEQADKFQIYCDLLIEWNKKINLTAIIDPKEVAVKHFIDSLLLIKAVDVKTEVRLIDVGTGAGFPGIPVKILRQDIELTLLDGLNKRLIFLDEVCQNLEIKAKLVHKRAEEAGRAVDMREKYDIVTARAVAKMNTLCEYCIPLLKKGGLFVAMKGPGLEQELCEAKNAITQLGSKLILTKDYILPGENMGERKIAVIQKDTATSKEYPRHGNKISKTPL